MTAAGMARKVAQHASLEIIQGFESSEENAAQAACAERND
jgi:hypothetical protein